MEIKLHLIVLQKLIFVKGTIRVRIILIIVILVNPAKAKELKP